MKVNLTPEQELLRNTIEENLRIARDWKDNKRHVVEDAFEKMSSAAHQLHMQLEPRPKHHRYMIENRGVSPESSEFYNHIHPVEDLLKYLDDMSANDDPIDHTIGDEFYFKVYTNRWGHYDQYQLTRNEAGWIVSALSYQGQDDNYGSKILKSAMEHDSVSFPRNYDSYLGSIWHRAQDEGLTHEQVQQMLNEVADWISQTEKNAPRHLLI